MQLERHAIIYLEPCSDEVNDDTGRLWCEHDQWSNEVEKSDVYILSDVVITREHCLSSLARQSMDEMWRVKEIAQDAIPIVDSTIEIIKELHNAKD